MKRVYFFLFVFSGALFGASFDCAQAKTDVEKMICSDTALSALDESLSTVWEEALHNAKDKKQLKRAQLQWIKERDRCATGSCIGERYRERISDLGRYLWMEPKIVPEVSNVACLESYTLAKTLFHSTSLRLYGPLEFPQTMNSQLVLGNYWYDLSGENYLQRDESRFEKIPQLDNRVSRSVYWERQTRKGIRLVVKETGRGWRGNTYSLYMLNEEIGQDTFLKALEEYRDIQFNPLFEGRWRPPLVFDTNASERWFLLVGEPYVTLGAWQVYQEADEGGFEQSCAIRFFPEDTDTVAFLPPRVQQLVRLLDKSIGEEVEGEGGTLRSFDRLRIHTRQVWTNASVRPWAVLDSNAYNSADEVTKGLEAWSQGDAYASKLYQDILRLYPSAQTALSDYYRDRFAFPKEQADTMAKKILDIAFRSSYMFHRERS